METKRNRSEMELVYRRKRIEKPETSQDGPKGLQDQRGTSKKSRKQQQEPRHDHRNPRIEEKPIGPRASRTKKRIKKSESSQDRLHLARGGSSLPSVRLGDGSLRRVGSPLAVEEIAEIPVSSRLALTKGRNVSLSIHSHLFIFRYLRKSQSKFEREGARKLSYLRSHAKLPSIQLS